MQVVFHRDLCLQGSLNKVTFNGEEKDIRIVRAHSNGHRTIHFKFFDQNKNRAGDAIYTCDFPEGKPVLGKPYQVQLQGGN